MADKKPENDEQRDEPNPWERFRMFGSKGAAVPKEDADENGVSMSRNMIKSKQKQNFKRMCRHPPLALLTLAVPSII
jgi:hypothetical protein